MPIHPKTSTHKDIKNGTMIFNKYKLNYNNNEPSKTSRNLEISINPAVEAAYK